MSAVTPSLPRNVGSTESKILKSRANFLYVQKTKGGFLEAKDNGYKSQTLETRTTSARNSCAPPQ